MLIGSLVGSFRIGRGTLEKLVIGDFPLENIILMKAKRED
jgi:hypothetical protein